MYNIAPAVITLLHGWQLWALLSELLLAITHIKVLLCVGKPYPAQELSSKRYTYFLYDLASPWLALSSLLASCKSWTAFCFKSSQALGITMALLAATSVGPNHGLQALALNNSNNWNSDAAAGGNIIFETGVGEQQQNQHQHMRQQSTLVQPPLALSTNISSADWQASNQLEVTILQLPPVLQQAGPVLPIDSRAWQGEPPAAHLFSLVMPELLKESLSLRLEYVWQLPMVLLLLLLVMGHSLLHLFYVVTWHQKHSRNVIEMSASSSMGSRFQDFNFKEATWFVAGTSYDIITHVVISSLLLQSVLS
eukprot:gene4026-4274_t